MHVTITEKSIEALERNRVYTTVDGLQRFQIGEAVFFDAEAYVEPYCAVLSGNCIPSIGSFSYSWSHIPEGMSIGRYCSIAHGLSIIGGNHPTSFLSTSSFTYDGQFVIFRKCLEDFNVNEFNRYEWCDSRENRHSLPAIGNDVWIGGMATLARGISLGDGCIVAANSVVTRSVPPYAIVGGNPARIIKMRFDDKSIDELISTKWWEYKFADFSKMRYDNVDIFVEEFKSKVERGEILPFPSSNTRIRVADLLCV